MICIEGKTAFSGIAIGPIREFAKKSSAVRRSHVDDTAAECTRFEEAKKVAMEELGALYDKAVKEVGEDNAAIFEVHQMMLDDEDYCDSIRNIITTQEVNAEFAVATTGDNFAAMFAGMDDEYMKARSADVKDISERLIAVLHHGSGAQSMEMEQAIILADEPTGALDSTTGRMVMDLFHKLHEEEGKTIVLITHSPELAGECQRIVTIKDGRVTGVRRGGGAADAAV